MTESCGDFFIMMEICIGESDGDEEEIEVERYILLRYSCLKNGMKLTRREEKKKSKKDGWLRSFNVRNRTAKFLD